MRSPKSMDELNDAELRQKMNLETARISWHELQRHFARGAVLVVAESLDLIDVGLKLARDERDTIAAWTDDGQLRHAEDNDALAWNERQAELWALVVAPWVLVQADRKTA